MESNKLSNKNIQRGVIGDLIFYLHSFKFILNYKYIQLKYVQYKNIFVISFSDDKKRDAKNCSVVSYLVYTHR